jgi:hypothetical protein
MTTMCTVARLILAVAVMSACSLAQGTTPEKHAKDIEAEQTQDVMASSQVCQESGEDKPYVYKIRPVDQETLAQDMAGLMEMSDEVLLARQTPGSSVALSPAGDDVFEYFDMQVLRSWKGALKAGEIVTITLPVRLRMWHPGAPAYVDVAESGFRFRPQSTLRCPWQTINGKPLVVDIKGVRDWQGAGHDPYVLFLRKSTQEDLVRIAPGFRLAGGDGLQGMYALENSITEGNRNCGFQTPAFFSTTSGNGPACIASLEASQRTVFTGYRPASGGITGDPILKKYGPISVSNFLKEVQGKADSLGYSTQAEVKK